MRDALHLAAAGRLVLPLLCLGNLAPCLGLLPLLALAPLACLRLRLSGLALRIFGRAWILGFAYISEHADSDH